MKQNPQRRVRTAGFTLIEVMVASAVSVLVLAGAMAGMIQAMRAWHAAGVRAELHMNLELSMERMRHDLRLSSVGIGLMAFYPADAVQYSAISIPLATPNAQGFLPRDTSGNIIWDTTVVYHVRPGSPDELIRSTFSPRDQDASPADLYDQLVKVVNSASLAEVQHAAIGSEIASSRVIFQNLVDMVFRPPHMRFDGYAPQYERARRFTWGSVVLSNGVNALTFTADGRNASSSGYKMGIDRVALSYSASPREAEMVLPQNAHPLSPYFQYSISAGSVIAEDMSPYGANWSGRSQLTYTPSFTAAGRAGSRLTFQMENDLWCDTNFDNPPGTIAENCRRQIDRSFTNQPPYIPDIVIAMNTGISWQAENVTDGVYLSGIVTNLAAINVIHGAPSATEPSAIEMNGAFARFAFAAGIDHSLHVRNVVFGERDGTSAAFVPGSERSLTFGGDVHSLIGSGSINWSDWIRYGIDRDKSYLVKWERRDAGDSIPVGQTDARKWTNPDGLTLSYLDGVATNQTIALAAMEVRAASNATYRSGVFDTRIDDPQYKQLVWTQVAHGSDGNIGLRVRSSDYADMHDAIWYPSSYYLSSNTGNDITAVAGGRYLQYEALFSVADDHTEIPVLRDVTITWEAPTGIVDLVVDLARGPDYGIITADVNDQSFIKGVEVELEIFKEGPYGLESVPGIMEVRPLNTGR